MFLKEGQKAITTIESSQMANSSNFILITNEYALRVGSEMFFILAPEMDRNERIIDP